MKSITKLVMFLMMITMPVMANDIYVTQSGATLTLDVLQDGQNNTIGNSTTASTVTGATSNFNIDQIGNSNVLTSPFPLSDPKIDTNISIREKDYADAMEKMKCSKKNNIKYNENIYNFSYDSVHKKWHKLIGKILKI